MVEHHLQISFVTKESSLVPSVITSTIVTTKLQLATTLRLSSEDGKTWLLKSNDPIKDQTYFLSNLSKKQLERCLFPIGHFPKSEVRALAEKYNLPNKARKDSQGICFLRKDQILRICKSSPWRKRRKHCRQIYWQGPRKTQRFWFHTIGQRKGLRSHEMVVHGLLLRKIFRTISCMWQARWLLKKPQEQTFT